MSYVCYATNELVNEGKREMVPIKQRKVLYNNFLVYQRGLKIYKQYMGTSNGFETVEERPVQVKFLEEFLRNHVPEIVGEKSVTNEYSKWPISREAMQKAQESNNIVVINEPPISEEMEATRKIYDDTFEKEEDFE